MEFFYIKTTLGKRI